jgi:hypothetical protein
MGLLRVEMTLFAWAGLELTLRERRRSEATRLGPRVARTLVVALLLGALVSVVEFGMGAWWRGDASAFARLEGGLGRNYRPLLDHNALGSAMVLLLPVSIVAAGLAVRRRFSQVAPGGRSFSAADSLAPLACVAGAAMLVTSRSKSALAGCAFALLVLGSLFALRSGARLRRIFLVVCSLGVLVLLGFNLAPDSLIDPIAGTRYGHDLVRVARLDAAAEYIEDNRATVWRGARSVGAEHPIVGVGLGRLPLLLAEHHDPEDVGWFNPLHENAHSQYLQILAEEGWVGLLLFLCALALAIAGGCRRGPWGYAGAAGVAGLALNLSVGHALLMPAVAVVFAGLLGWLLAGPLADANGVELSSGPSSSTLGCACGLAFLLAMAPLSLPGGKRPLPLEELSLGCYPWEFQAGQNPDRARAISADARWFQVWGQGRVMKIPVRDVRDPRFDELQVLTVRAFAPGAEEHAEPLQFSLPHLTLGDLAQDPQAAVNPTTYLRIEAPEGVAPGDLVELHVTARSSFNGSRVFSLDHREVAARIWPPFFQK